ncbi:acyltransferase [Lawsonibacter sp. LCP25S3_G6]|uniref:acyltransferase n=1 Tax=unclassified Lawsonibacter TaxID=2617946 RepID=UPI003F95AAA8
MVRRQELSYMNALASLAVILIHVLSLGISSLTPGTWQSVAVYLPWRLAAFVVPMFLYTGAVKMAMQVWDKPLGLRDYLGYCLRRIQKIYLPYVLWVVIYYLAFWVIHYVRGDWGEFFSYLWLGNLSSPFYYIVIVMQFYFLMPLWRWTVRHLSPFVGMSLSLLVTLFMQQLPALLPFPYYDRIFPTYLLFWMAGLYVGRYYRGVRLLRNGWNLVLAGAGALFCAGLACWQYATRQWVVNLDLIKLCADLLSIFFLHSLCLSLTRAPQRLQSLLVKLSQCSFFVYLSHCLFLTLITAFLQNRGVTSVGPLLAARFAVCYTFPFLCYWIYRKMTRYLPFARGLLG